MILLGDVLDRIKEIPDGSVNTIVTSPPYYALRDYGVDGQMGLEDTPEEYIQRMANVFDECYRILRDDGTLWLNIGDTYVTAESKGKYQEKHAGLHKAKRCSKVVRARRVPAGMKVKDLMGIPWMLAFELRKRGWYLRQDIIWNKTNPMPESVTDRCSKAHEYIFLLSKSDKYYYDCDSIRTAYAEKSKTTWGCEYKGNGDGSGLIASENLANDLEVHKPHHKGANKKSVWRTAVSRYKEAHFATFPTELIEDCVKAGSPPGGIVFDPFMGSGTTAVVSVSLQRHYLGIELNPKYLKLAEKRISGTQIKMVI